ncbi:hypothetical protein GCM10010518_19710 [Kitasatospora cinereorecta]
MVKGSIASGVSCADRRALRPRPSARPDGFPAVVAALTAELDAPHHGALSLNSTHVICSPCR